MTYTAPRDQNYYDQVRQTEFRLQGAMDNLYISLGFEIISRDGTYKHDLILSKNDKNYKVEEKYRSSDNGDFLIELVQDLTTFQQGWFYSEKPDAIVYILHKDNKLSKIYWIDFIGFRNWWFDYLSKKRIQKAIISPKGFGLTLNLVVPWSTIPEKLYKVINL